MKHYVVIFLSVLAFGVIVGTVLPETTPARPLVVALIIAAFAGLATKLLQKEP